MDKTDSRRCTTGSTLPTCSDALDIVFLNEHGFALLRTFTVNFTLLGGLHLHFIQFSTCTSAELFAKLGIQMTAVTGLFGW